MTSLNTNSSLAALEGVKRSIITFTQVWCSCLFAIGALGHGLSIYVLTRPTFRSNPSTRYFLAMTVTGGLIVYVTLPLRILQYAGNIDLFMHSNQSCRILSYLIHCFRAFPSWFVVLTAIDRFLCSSSSANLRRWSSVRVTTPAIALTILLVLLIYIHTPFNYAILLPQQVCDATTNTYRGFLALWNLVCWSWIPSTGMLVFGSLTISHLREAKRRIVPQNVGGQVQRSHKKIDRQLTNMLLLQCFVFVSISAVSSVASLYVTISNSLRTKTALEIMQDTYLTVVSNSISVTGPCTSFYMFTLTSPLFRRVLGDLFRRSPPSQEATKKYPVNAVQQRELVAS